MAYNNVRRDPEDFHLPVMKPPALQTEIRLAVKDYVDQLINERTGPGKGMALSASDLMTAARVATKKVQSNGVDKQSLSYLKPGLLYLQETVPHKDHLTTKQAPTVPKPSSKPKREPHWLTWKTGRTPQPPSTAARPPSSISRPPSAIARPPSVAARPPTAVRPPTAARPPTARDDEADVEILNLMTPEPPRAVSVARGRMNTPAAQRAMTPAASLHTDYRDQVQTALKPKTPQNPAYMPALKAWVSHANDYEKDVAFSLMQVLSTNSLPTEKRLKPRARSAGAGVSRLTLGQQRNISKTAGVRTSFPAAWQQIYQDPRHEQYIVNGMARELQRQDPCQMSLGPADGPRPLGKHMKTHATAVSYDNHGSMFMDYPEMSNPYATTFRRLPERVPVPYSTFMNSQAPYKTAFTIHPEWASEMSKPPAPFRKYHK